MHLATYALIAGLALTACSATKTKLSQRERKKLAQAGTGAAPCLERIDMLSMGRKGCNDAWQAKPASRLLSNSIVHNNIDETAEAAIDATEEVVASSESFPDLQASAKQQKKATKEPYFFNRTRTPLLTTMAPDELRVWELSRTQFAMLSANAYMNAYDTSAGAIVNVHSTAERLAGRLEDYERLDAEISHIMAKSQMSWHDSDSLRKLVARMTNVQGSLTKKCAEVCRMIQMLPRSNAVPPSTPKDRRLRASPLISVGTLNAQFLMDDYRQTRGSWNSPLDLMRHVLTVARMLAEMDSDVIVVNEVGSFGALELARVFMGAKGKDYRVYYLPNSKENDIAPAFLSRIDIVYPLMVPKAKEGFYMRCTTARFEVAIDSTGGMRHTVEVYGAHLASNKARALEASLERRVMESEIILAAVNQAMTLEPRTLFVIAGDMNEEDPVAVPDKVLERPKVFTVLRAGGKFASCYDGLQRATPTHGKGIIDYIMAPKAALGGTAAHGALKGTRNVSPHAFAGKPGDHSGVSVQLLIPGLDPSLYSILTTPEDLANGFSALSVGGILGDTGDHRPALNVHAREFVPRFMCTSTVNNACAVPDNGNIVDGIVSQSGHNTATCIGHYSSSHALCEQQIAALRLLQFLRQGDHFEETSGQ